MLDIAFKTLSLLVIAAAATPVFAVQAPAFKLKNAVAAGSGCASGTDLKATVVDGRIQFTMPTVEARTGKDVSLRDARKACGAIFTLDHGADVQYRVHSLKSRVHSSGKEAFGLVRAEVRYQGEQTAIFQDIEMKGDQPQKEALLSFGGSTWSSCDNQRPLVVQLASKLGKVPQDGSTAQVGYEGPVEVELEWRNCVKK